MNTLRILTLTLLFIIPASLTSAETDCSRGSVLESSEVKLTPISECLKVEVSGQNCFEGVSIEFTNNCGSKITVERLDNNDDEFIEEINPKDWEEDSVQYEENIEEKVSYKATIDAEIIDIKISFTATNEINEEPSCSSVGTGNFSLFLLGFGLLLIRRKKRQ